MALSPLNGQINSQSNILPPSVQTMHQYQASSIKHRASSVGDSHPIFFAGPIELHTSIAAERKWGGACTWSLDSSLPHQMMSLRRSSIEKSKRGSPTLSTTYTHPQQYNIFYPTQFILPLAVYLQDQFRCLFISSRQLYPHCLPA
jgi:hypothetical protein